MLILKSDQVQYYKAISVDSQTPKVIKVVVYQNRLFSEYESYPKAEQEAAIQATRRIFSETQGQVYILLVEEEEQFVIWQEDQEITTKYKAVLQEDKIRKINLNHLVKQMRGENGLSIKNRWYNFKLYPSSFIGNEATTWLMKTLDLTQEDALELGKLLIKKRFIHHVTDDHDFKNEHLFYRFYLDEEKKPT